MAIADDVAVNYAHKRVFRPEGASSTVYSVNALYTRLMEVFAASAQMDDATPMSAQTPTAYTMTNGWYIQQELTRYLSGGAIQTSGYANAIRTLLCGPSGWTNFVPGDLGTTVSGSITGDSGGLLDYDNDNYKLWVRMDDSGDLFDNASENYTTSGTGQATAISGSITGETLYANPYTLGSIVGSPQLYVYQNGARLPEWWSTGHFDTLIKVADAGEDIDGRVVTVFGHNLSDTYTHYELTLTAAGQNAVPLGNQDDPFNQTAEATIEDYQDGTLASVDINFSFTAPYSYDIGDGEGSKPYEAQLDCDNQRFSIVYEVLKFWTREGSIKALKTDSDATTVSGEAFRAVSTSYNEVVTSPLGTFVGGKLYLARSIYPINVAAEDIKAFQIIDKNGDTHDPPVSVAFSINGLQAGSEVRIYKVSDDSEVDGTESSSTFFTYNYTYGGDIPVYVIIHHVDYVWIKLTGLVLTNTSQSIPVQQRFDRNYDNPENP